MPSISIVIPAYNEELSLEKTVERCSAVLRAVTQDYEIIIIDDESKDRTWEIMKRLKNMDSEHLQIKRHDHNRGIAVTFEELYREATKEYIFLIPGDGQYPPEALFEIAPMLTSCDVVICNRTYKHYTFWRLFISACYRWLPKILFGVDLYDSGSTKCIRRSIIHDTPVRSKGVFVEAERIIRAAKRGHRIGKVDIVQEARKGGRARGAKPSLLLEAIIDMLALWWRLEVLREKP